MRIVCLKSFNAVIGRLTITLVALAFFITPVRADTSLEPMRSQMVEVRDTNLFVREAGDGEPALFLHAFLTNGDLWLSQLSGLSDSCRCIAPDLRGFGRSDPYVNDTLDPYLYAEDVAALIEALDINEPLHLVGMSVGGFIAGLVYEKMPERIASVTFISTRFEFEPNPVYRRYQAEMARLAVVEGKDAVFRRFDEYIDGTAPSLHARARYKTMLESTRTEMIVAYLLNTGQTAARPDLPPMIKAPVLIPLGSADYVLSERMAEGMRKEFPNARIEMIPEAGRLLPLEAPSRLNDLLKSHWKSAPKQ